MSEETALKLKEAEAAFASAEAAATTSKNELLATVARHLPGHAKHLAKRTAQSEPDVTRALGADGVTKLRAELEATADELAADIAGAASKIIWPTPSHFSPVTSNDIRTALFNYLHGQRVGKLAKLFKDSGYNIHDNNNRGSQSLVLPQFLFKEEEMSAEIKSLGSTLMALFKANEAVVAAKKADDLADVDDLWGD